MSNLYKGKDGKLVDVFQMTEEVRHSISEWPIWLREAWETPSREIGAIYPEFEGQEWPLVHRSGEPVPEGEIDNLGTIRPGAYICRAMNGAMYVPPHFDMWYSPFPFKAFWVNDDMCYAARSVAEALATANKDSGDYDDYLQPEEVYEADYTLRITSEEVVAPVYLGDLLKEVIGPVLLAATNF